MVFLNKFDFNLKIDKLINSCYIYITNITY